MVSTSVAGQVGIDAWWRTCPYRCSNCDRDLPARRTHMQSGPGSRRRLAHRVDGEKVEADGGQSIRYIGVKASPCETDVDVETNSQAIARAARNARQGVAPISSSSRTDSIVEMRLHAGATNLGRHHHRPAEPRAAEPSPITHIIGEQFGCGDRCQVRSTAYTLRIEILTSHALRHRSHAVSKLIAVASCAHAPFGDWPAPGCAEGVHNCCLYYI